MFESISNVAEMTKYELPIGNYVDYDVSINDLQLKNEDFISLKIGVKKDAKYVGGLSLFGKSFGDYNQDILVSFYW